MFEERLHFKSPLLVTERKGVDHFFLIFDIAEASGISHIWQWERGMGRGGRYIDEKLSKADKSVFLKLSAIYRYRKVEILKLSKNYRYRKMHQILADK